MQNVIGVWSCYLGKSEISLLWRIQVAIMVNNANVWTGFRTSSWDVGNKEAVGRKPNTRWENYQTSADFDLGVSVVFLLGARSRSTISGVVKLVPEVSLEPRSNKWNTVSQRWPIKTHKLTHSRAPTANQSSNNGPDVDETQGLWLSQSKYTAEDGRCLSGKQSDVGAGTETDWVKVVLQKEE